LIVNNKHPKQYRHMTPHFHRN